MLNLNFVSISGGEFLMGSLPGDIDHYFREGYMHRVIVNSFQMMTTQVTQAQWKAVMGIDPSFFKGDDRPVERVTWNDCQEFIRELNKLDPGKGYRLPTEAEWEYACHAGTVTRYNTGNSESDLDRAGWYDGNSGNTTHPVAQKLPNAWGLYDMHGNVWEWCEDDYHERYDGAPTDGSAWINSPRGDARVLRGGSWLSPYKACQSTRRLWTIPDHCCDHYGFRVVRTF